MAFVTAVNIWMNVFPIYDSKCANGVCKQV